MGAARLGSLILNDQKLILKDGVFMVTVCLHLSEGFPILSLTLITEPLRLANRELGRPNFRWVAVSDDGGILRASSGIPLETSNLPEERQDIVILLASYHPDRSATDRTLSWLRRQERLGAMMGCVDTGALVFARAGLLEMRPAAAHPEAIAGFHRQFPNSLFIDRLFDVSPPRVSSAGGVATLDMTLGLIGHVAGGQLSRRVAEVLTYEPSSGDRTSPRIPAGIASAVRDAVEIMAANPGRCLPVSEIAGRLGLPVWKLSRLFRRYLHQSPTGYYLDLRLSRARDMLRNTSLPVSEIGADCGYDNAEVFTRAYRKRFGSAPSRDRVPDTGDLHGGR